MRYKKNRRSWTDEQLIEAVPRCDSMSQVLQLLGLKVTAAGNRRTVKLYIQKLNLDTSHWTGQGWVGTREFHPVKKSLAEILTVNSSYPTSHLRLRLFKEKVKEPKCENCGLTIWLGQEISFELDHINGVSNDHRIENLRVLCPNCHSQTPTWRGRNNGSLVKAESRLVEAQ